MRHVALATALVLTSSGCVSFIDPIDMEPCQTLKCVKRVEFKQCLRDFRRRAQNRGFVIIYPDDDPQFQVLWCRNKVSRLRVY